MVFLKWIYHLYAALKSVINYLKAVQLALRLPGPPAHPIIGNAFTVANSKVLQEIGTEVSCYTPLCRIWVFFVPFILVYEPEHLKIILGNARVSEKNFFYSVMHTFIGDGLVTSRGAKWRKHRKLIQPLFHNNHLSNYLEVFSEISEEMCRKLPDKLAIVRITTLINQCVLKMLLNPQDGEGHDARRARYQLTDPEISPLVSSPRKGTVLGVNDVAEVETPFRRGELLLIKRILKPWLLFDQIFQYSQMSKEETRQYNDLHGYVKKVFDQKVQENTCAGDCCLLDKLIELHHLGELSEKDVLNEAVTFMLAGQDTVGAAVAFCLYYLAKHQQVQSKVHREIIDVLNDGDVLGIDQLKHLVYLEQCIKETLRMVPSIPLIARVLNADVKLGGHTIPCGTNIFVSPFATHRLPRYFPDPMKFDPDRFSPDNTRNMHPYAFLPFSLGPRNCIGYKFTYMEMKVILVNVLRSYTVSLESEEDQLELAYRVTLRAQGGVRLKIKPRNQSYVD